LNFRSIYAPKIAELIRHRINIPIISARDVNRSAAAKIRKKWDTPYITEHNQRLPASAGSMSSLSKSKENPKPRNTLNIISWLELLQRQTRVGGTYATITTKEIVKAMAVAEDGSSGWLVYTLINETNPKIPAEKRANLNSFQRMSFKFSPFTSLAPRALVIITPGWLPALPPVPTIIGTKKEMTKCFSRRESKLSSMIAEQLWKTSSPTSL
jgi:hypothetical protein